MEILPLSLTLTPADLKLAALSSSGASASSNSPDKRVERRKPNWTECENVFLLDQFGLHREILTCKATDASTNLRKQEVWRIICQNLNKQNVQVRRTPAEVRRKWKNLVTAAKKEVWEIRHQAHVTGTSRKLSELSQRVLQLHSTTASAIALFMSGSGNTHRDLNGNDERDYDKNGGGAGSIYYGGGVGSHFTPIVQFSESISSPNGSESCSGSGGGELDSGIYEEATDLRVNKHGSSGGGGGMTNGGGGSSAVKVKVEQRSTRVMGRGLMPNGNGNANTGTGSDFDDEDEDDDDIMDMGQEQDDDLHRRQNEDLTREKLELQIEVFRLRKRKLEIEIRRLRRSPAFAWRRRIPTAAKWFKYYNNKYSIN